MRQNMTEPIELTLRKKFRDTYYEWRDARINGMPKYAEDLFDELIKIKEYAKSIGMPLSEIYDEPSHFE